MKIAIASDHGGFRLKGEVIEHFKVKGIWFEDFGTNSEQSCDYSDLAEKVCEAVLDKKFDFGILICGTGIGIGIAANKIPGIRAALCCDTFSAHACREHNNANVLTLGQRVVGTGLALDIVDTFLNSHFEGDRHQRRIDKITQLEKKYSK